MAICRGNLKSLLLESPEAYYWAGFIAADGNLNKGVRLQINLSIKDKRHLLKLAKFLKISNLYFQTRRNSKQICLSVQDCILIPLFMKKFDLKQRKTYNPPNLNWLNGDKFLSFVAGYIDGDGYLTSRYGGIHLHIHLHIHCHSSWEPVLRLIEQRLPVIIGVYPKRKKTGIIITKKGYVSFHMYSYPLFREFKRKLLELNLPILKRKWNHIDLNKRMRYE